MVSFAEGGFWGIWRRRGQCEVQTLLQALWGPTLWFWPPFCHPVRGGRRVQG